MVVAIAECYIKGEESNAKKNACDVKERVPDAESFHPVGENIYTSPVKDKSKFKKVGKTTNNFTPLNTPPKIDLARSTPPAQHPNTACPYVQGDGV